MQTISVVLYRKEMLRPKPAHVPREHYEPPFWTWFIENPPSPPKDETSTPPSDDPDQL